MFYDLSLNVKVLVNIAILILTSQFHLRAQTELLAGFAVDIYDSSVNHFFDKYEYVDHIRIFYRNQQPDIIDSLQPTLKGDTLKLTRDLENEFKTMKRIRTKDSIIILSGIVEKNGTIGPLSLIEGDNSDYTRTVLAFLSREATLWSPKRETSGTKRVSPVRISVRAKKDGTMKISIL